MRIVLVPVPLIINNTTAIPAVILTVNLFLFIYNIEFVRKYIRCGLITQNDKVANDDPIKTLGRVGKPMLLV